MAEDHVLIELKNTIKSYPDFPKKDIIFRDFFPILQNPQLFEKMLCCFQKWLKDNAISVDCIVGLDSRGFLIGPPLALKLGISFIPVRKAGKLPGDVKKQFYALEYGSDALEIQLESFKQEQKVVIVDDLLATGGTMAAAVKLISSIGASVEQCFVVIELDELNGRQKIPAPVHSLVHY